MVGGVRCVIQEQWGASPAGPLIHSLSVFPVFAVVSFLRRRPSMTIPTMMKAGRLASSAV